MHRHLLSTRPSVLHHGGQRHIAHLLNHIHFAQNIFLLDLRQVVDALAVAHAYVLNMAQPVVGQSDTGTQQSCTHPCAAIVPHHHDVLHLEMLDCELDGGQGVQVGVHHQIGHIAVHEDLAWV